MKGVWLCIGGTRSDQCQPVHRTTSHRPTTRHAIQRLLSDNAATLADMAQGVHLA